MKNLTKTLFAISLAVGISATAQAIPTLELSDGVTTVLVTDGDGDGVLSFSGAVGGNWTVNVSTALTYPVLGDINNPFMDLNSVNVGVGTLTITFTADGFVKDPGTAFSEIGGTTQGTVNYVASSDGSNLTSLGSFSGGAFSDSAMGGTAGGNPFSLTQVVTIEHEKYGVSSFDATLSVPDGGITLILLGLAISGIALFGRRRIRAA